MPKTGAGLLLSLLVLVVVPGWLHAEKCPNFLIVLDKSGSMLRNPAGETEMDPNKRKWNIAQKALTGIVNSYSGRLPIGFSLFPTNNMCSVGNGPDIPPDYGTREAILKAIQDTTPAGSTPTCQAIISVAMSAPLKDASRRQFILLVTDGEPTTTCCGADPVSATVKAIADAHAATPPIKTFVLGFGALTNAQREAMNRISQAGGVPDESDGTGTYRYYRAEDEAALKSALDRILAIVVGELGMGACDDSCYSNPCPDGQRCIAAECKQDPCANVSCEGTAYCYTNGSSAGACVEPCMSACAQGTRCDHGRCVDDPCGSSCGPGRVCNPTSGRCETDIACEGVSCRSPLRCVAGACVDDPCTLVTCPASTRCIPWTGMCQAVAGAPEPGDGGPLCEECPELSGGCGCNLPPSDGAAARGALLLALIAAAALLLRRAR